MTEAALRCPGITAYRPGRAGDIRHGAGCCASFAALSPAEKALRGGIPVTAADDRRPAPPPHHVEIITVADLAARVDELARLATAHPDEQLQPDHVWVEYGPADDAKQVLALVDWARAYHLVVGHRHNPHR